MATALVAGAGLEGSKLLLASVFASVADQFVLGWLFGPDNIEGERIADIPVPQTGEGAAAPVVFGQHRSEALIAHQGPPQSINVGSSSAGKGGPDITNWETRVDLLLLFATNPIDYAQETSSGYDPDNLPGTIGALYADGDVVWAKDASVEVVLPSSWTITASEPDAGTVQQGFLRIDAVLLPATEEALEQIQVGQPLITSGFANAANNFDGTPGLGAPGVFVTDSFKGINTGDWYLYWQRQTETDPGPSGYFANESGPQPGATLQQNVVPINLPFESIEFVYFDDAPLDVGSSSKAAMDAYALSKGVDVSLLPGLAAHSGVFLKGFNVSRYGGRIPVFHAAYCDDALDAETITRTLLRRAGYPLDRFDVDLDPSDALLTLPGLIRRGSVPLRDSLVAMLGALNLQAVEAGGRFTLKSRRSAEPIVIPEGDLGAQDLDGEPLGLDGELAPEADVANEVTVDFANPDDDFQVNSETARTPIQPGSAERVSLRTVAMDRARARQIALRALGDARGDAVRLSLPPKYVGLRPADTVRVDTAEGVRYTLEIRQRTREPVTGRIIIEAIPVPEEKIELSPPTQ